MLVACITSLDISKSPWVPVTASPSLPRGTVLLAWTVAVTVDFDEDVQGRWINGYLRPLFSGELLLEMEYVLSEIV